MLKNKLKFKNTDRGFSAQLPSLENEKKLIEIATVSIAGEDDKFGWTMDLYEHTGGRVNCKRRISGGIFSSREDAIKNAKEYIEGIFMKLG